MNFAQRIIRNALVLILLSTQLSWAISKEMHALVRLETHSNAVASRESDFVKMPHYEIPLRLLESSIELDAPKEYLKSLIHEINGEKYVRWVLNPEDTKWDATIVAFLKQNGIEPVKQTYFAGYMTASRSYILVDPKSGAEFSLKSSTNKTGGMWVDKKQTWADSFQIRTLSDYVRDRIKHQPPLEHSIILYEPIAFGIKDSDIGIIVRSYKDLPKSGKRYVPGFSILHENLGRDLAKRNGSSDPAAYWNENYNKPLARALAEFFALTGIRYDSPHSQNFLVELNEKNQPTGKIVLRDFGDSFLHKDIFDAIGRNDIIKIWEQDNVIKGEVGMAVGTLHGNTPPTWINAFPKQQIANRFLHILPPGTVPKLISENKSQQDYDTWGADFFTEFEKEFARQTGIELTFAGTHRKSGMYFMKSYDLLGNSNFLELFSKDAQRNTLKALSCKRMFIN
jgi:hypothetical protein